MSCKVPCYILPGRTVESLIAFLRLHGVLFRYSNGNLVILAPECYSVIFSFHIDDYIQSLIDNYHLFDERKVENDE